MDEEEKLRIVVIIEKLLENSIGRSIRLERIKSELENGLQTITDEDKNFVLDKWKKYNEVDSIIKSKSIYKKPKPFYKKPKLNFKSPIFQFAIVIMFVVMFVSIGTSFYEPEPEVWVITRTDVTPEIIETLSDYGTDPEEYRQLPTVLKFSEPQVTTRNGLTVENYFFDWYVIGKDTSISFVIRNGTMEIIKSNEGIHKASLYYKWDKDAGELMSYNVRDKSRFYRLSAIFAEELLKDSDYSALSGVPSGVRIWYSDEFYNQQRGFSFDHETSINFPDRHISASAKLTKETEMYFEINSYR